MLHLCAPPDSASTRLKMQTVRSSLVESSSYDYTLAETWYGRAFIRTYYAISPILVKWFGHTEWFKKMWKGKLDRMVANLNVKGVEDTPYEDRNWF